MRSQFYLTGVWVVIVVTAAFLFEWDPQIGIGIFSPPILLLIILLFCVSGVWDVMGALTLWRTYRYRSLLPLCLLISSFFLAWVGGKCGFHLRLKRFERNLPEYESLVSVVERNDRCEMARRGMKVFSYDPSFMSIDLPENMSHLAWGMRVRRDKDDEAPTIVFVYAGGFEMNFADYVYRADGDFSNALKKMNLYFQGPINAKWCAAGR